MKDLSNNDDGHKIETKEEKATSDKGLDLLYSKTVVPDKKGNPFLKLIAVVVMGLVMVSTVVHFFWNVLDDPNVIGIQPVEDTAISATILVHYFPYRSDAIKYYESIGAEKYCICLTKYANKTEEWLKNHWGESTEDGGKIIGFLASNRILELPLSLIHQS